jgi:hypothetical protein
MSKPDRELLPPEEATSLEEFQARRIAEQLQIRGMNSTNKRLGLILLSSLLAFLAIFGWIGVAQGTGGARWVFLVLALGFSYGFFRIFGGIELRGVRGSKRYVQLTRMSKDWQARARRGEIPETSPGGPKVWRDELNGAETS